MPSIRVVAILVAFLLGAPGCKSANPAAGLARVMSTDPLTGPSQRSTTAEAPPAGEELPAKAAATLCLTMAESLEREGKDADAILYYERARELDRSQAERAGRRLAVLYDKIDQQAKALAEFQELLKKRPKDSQLLNDLGYSYYNRGQWADAEATLRKAVAVDKTNKRAWMNLGLALAQQGRTAEAISAFEKVVSPADAHANVAFVLAARGDRAGALKAYRLALTLEPAHPIARVAVAKLEATAEPAAEPAAKPPAEAAAEPPRSPDNPDHPAGGTSPSGGG
jgi:Flp pilus assembly protein TadD